MIPPTASTTAPLDLPSSPRKRAPRRILSSTLLFPETPPVLSGLRLHGDVERVAWIFAQALFRAEVERQEQMLADGRLRHRRVHD